MGDHLNPLIIELMNRMNLRTENSLSGGEAKGFSAIF